MSGKPKAVKVIDSGIEKITLPTDALKAILKKEFGQDVGSISITIGEDLWTIEFLPVKGKAED